MFKRWQNQAMDRSRGSRAISKWKVFFRDSVVAVVLRQVQFAIGDGVAAGLSLAQRGSLALSVVRGEMFCEVSHAVD